MSLIKKFTIGLGIDNKGLTTSLKDADTDISNFISSIKTSFAALGIGAGFAGLVKDFADIGSSLDDFNKLTGISVEHTSRLGLALESFGGDTDTAMSSLESLQSGMQELVDWGSGPLLDVSRKYGLSIQDEAGRLKSVEQLYLDLADTMQHLNKQQQKDLASSLGLSDADILLLQKGKKGVEELLSSQNEMAVISAEDAKAAKEWKNTLLELKASMQMLGRQIARIVLPAISDVTKTGKSMAGIFVENKEIITSLASTIKNLLPVAFSIGAAKAALALKPLLLKMAPLSAIALLIEDIIVFFKGGDSALGSLLGDENSEKLRKTFEKIFGSLGSMFSSLLKGDFAGVAQEFKASFIPVIEELSDFIAHAFINQWKLIGVKLKETIALQLMDIPIIGKPFKEYAKNQGLVSDLKAKIPQNIQDEASKAGLSPEAFISYLNKRNLSLQDYKKQQEAKAQNAQGNNVTQNNTFNITSEKDLNKAAEKVTDDLIPALAFSS